MYVLTVTLAQGGEFQEVVAGLERAFEVGLSVQRDGHRRIAQGATERYLIRAVDRVDLLGPALDEDHHTVEVVVDCATLVERTEGEVLTRLQSGAVPWNTCRWREEIAEAI